MITDNRTAEVEELFDQFSAVYLPARAVGGDGRVEIHLVGDDSLALVFEIVGDTPRVRAAESSVVMRCGSAEMDAWVGILARGESAVIEVRADRGFQRLGVDPGEANTVLVSFVAPGARVLVKLNRIETASALVTAGIVMMPRHTPGLDAFLPD